MLPPTNPPKDKEKRMYAFSLLPIDNGEAQHYIAPDDRIREVREGEFPAEWFDDPDHARKSFEHYRNLWNNGQVQTDGAISPSLFNEDNDNDNLPFSRNFDDDINEWILKMIS